MKSLNVFYSLIFLLLIFSCDTQVEQNYDIMDELKDDTSTIDIKAEMSSKGYLTVINVESGKSFVAFESEQYFESPNWSQEGDYIYFNSLGKIFKLKLYSDALPEELNLDIVQNCNANHVLSPDQKVLGISSELDGESQIYTVSAEGGKPIQLTTEGSNYLGAWSIDGKSVIYSSLRNEKREIYTINNKGKKEIRLTSSEGNKYNPEYSPDGKYVYYSSDVSGGMQIWRMEIDGSNPEQLTNDDQSNCYPHVSPNGKKIAFLSYETGSSLPQNTEVKLKVMNTSDFKSRTVTQLYGGAGSLDVSSWSPDGMYLSFVNYEPKVSN